MRTRRNHSCVGLLLAANLAVAWSSTAQSLQEIENSINSFITSHYPDLSAGYWTVAPSGKMVAFSKSARGGFILSSRHHHLVHILDLEEQIQIGTVSARHWSWDSTNRLWYIDDQNRLFRFLPRRENPQEIVLDEELISKRLVRIIGIDFTSALLQARGSNDIFPGGLFLLDNRKRGPARIVDSLSAAEMPGDWSEIFFLNSEYFALSSIPNRDEYEPTVSLMSFRPLRAIARATVPQGYDIHSIVTGWRSATALAIACGVEKLSPVVYLLEKSGNLEMLAQPEEGSACAMREWEYCQELSEARLQEGKLEFIFAVRSGEMPRSYYVKHDGTMTCE